VIKCIGGIDGRGVSGTMVVGLVVQITAI